MSRCPIISPILIAFALCTVTAQAQWIDDPAIDAQVQKGIRATYNLQFAEAEQAFHSVAQARPEHPAGMFFLAMVDWWRILVEPEDDARDEAFVRRLARVITLCDARLDKDDRDLTALFFKGGAVGFRGRLRAQRKEWVKAADDGRIALPVVRAAGRIAPDNADLALGTGIYDYYAAVLPERYRVLKPVMLFLPAGDRGRGIALLKHAAEHARYANWEAMHFLVQLYSGFEGQPGAALPYARRLRAQFPGNSVFHRMLGRLQVQLGNTSEAAAIFEEVRAKVEANTPGYGPVALREAEYYLGLDAMQRGDLNPAMRHFVRCDELSRMLDREAPSGLMAGANLRIGMIHDLYGQRSLALRQYDKVLAMPDAGTHADAEKFRRQPYRRP